MIPKIIHCCWLGGPKTKLAEKCLASWRRFAPDWEIREWSEVRLEVLALPPFVKNALAARKWAFVADWLRFVALEREGGVYLDYDVELVAPITGLPDGEWVSGERNSFGEVAMNPGSGIALEKGSPIAKAMLKQYETAKFDGKTTVGELMASTAETSGLAVLPPEVMSPIGIDGKLHRTEKTVGIHWYAMSWASPKQMILQWFSWHGFRWAIDWALKTRGLVRTLLKREIGGKANSYGRFISFYILV